MEKFRYRHPAESLPCARPPLDAQALWGVGVTSIVARPLAAIALAGAVAAPGSSLPAAAQDKMTSETSPRLEAQRDQAAAFDIPAQPLGQALTAFGRQSGLQVAFDPAAAAGKASAAVSGSMTAEQAAPAARGQRPFLSVHLGARRDGVRRRRQHGRDAARSRAGAGPVPGALAGHHRQPAAALCRRPGRDRRSSSASWASAASWIRRSTRATTRPRSSPTSRRAASWTCWPTIRRCATRRRRPLRGRAVRARLHAQQPGHAFNGMYSAGAADGGVARYLERVELLKGPGVC